MLRQAREQAGVHVAALAVALKVPVRQLEALEQGRFDLLPDHTFARALAGSVCRQLKLDPKPVLAALPQGTPRAVSDNVGINEPFRNSTPVGGLAWRERLLRPPVLAAVLLLLAALALIVVPEIQQDSAPVSDTAQPAAAPAVPTASDKIVVESVTPLMVPSVPAPAAPAASAAPVPTPTPARPASSQPAASAAR
jgi:cytoskeleton protein RodZ